MDTTTIVTIALLIGLAAALYTSVGHAGASAYLAIMALFAVPAATMKPTALVLNIIVASIATFRFVRAGQFNGPLLLPFVAGAIPAAFIAGRMSIPGDYYRPLVGLVLWIAAARFLWPKELARLKTPEPPAWPIATATGGAIGFLSGLTGTGGGIFLSPLILFFGWEAVRKTSGVAAAFILCVSISGLAGNISSVGSLPDALPWFAAAAITGSIVGTRLGVAALPVPRLLQALGLVLIVAGAKLIFT